MEQPAGFVALRQIIHFFYRHSSVGCIYPVVYVDDIVLTGNHHHDISEIKQHICHHFQKILTNLNISWGLK